MPCFHPLSAWQVDEEPVVFKEVANAKALKLPCGQCIGCRLERSRQWAVRCMHEASLHADNVFVTLTYSDDWKVSESLVYGDFQDFVKRLRRFNIRRLRAEGAALPRSCQVSCVRHYMAGEYGEEFRRPHFHAILFGVFFPDREFFRNGPGGHKLWRSATLERLWPHGFSSIGDVTLESAAYVARYVTKKVTGDRAAEHYGEICEPVTGEIRAKVPEFNRMSLKPGIGAEWFRRYQAEVYPRDFVVVNGVKQKPPRYYDKLLAARYWDVVEWCEKPLFFRELESVEFDRGAKALAAWYDNRRERLEVREVVTKSRLTFRKRSLK